MVEVQEKSSGRSAHYKLTSTVMLWLQTNKQGSGTMNLGGSLTRQVGDNLICCHCKIRHSSGNMYHCCLLLKLVKCAGCVNRKGLIKNSDGPSCLLTFLKGFLFSPTGRFFKFPDFKLSSIVYIYRVAQKKMCLHLFKMSLHSNGVNQHQTRSQHDHNYRKEVHKIKWEYILVFCVVCDQE